MRYDKWNRIMSLSFERDPEEHAEVMMLTGRRLTGRDDKRYIDTWIFWFLAYAAGFGLVMELYRRYVLTLVADLSSIPPFSIAMLQTFPVFISLWILLLVHSRSQARRSRQALIQRLDKGVFIDADIYKEGIRASVGKMFLQAEWSAFRDVIIRKGLIEFASENSLFYLPVRAFDNPEVYRQRAEEIRALWQAAMLKDEQRPVEPAS